MKDLTFGINELMQKVDEIKGNKFLDMPLREFKKIIARLTTQQLIALLRDENLPKFHKDECIDILRQDKTAKELNEFLDSIESRPVERKEIDMSDYNVNVYVE